MYLGNIFANRPADRPLSATDRFYHLKQRGKLDCIPDGGGGVIALHDDYLETVDHAYPYKGGIALEYLILFFVVYLVAWAATWYFGDMFSELIPGTDYPAATFAAVMVLCFLPFYLWLMSKEFFVFTHYPIRFDRTTRSICLLRRDKTILRVPWDHMYFTCGHIPELEWWELRGYVLDWDDETVLDTFVLYCSGDSYRSKETGGETPHPSPSGDPLLRHWELVRRFMQEGRHAVAPFVERTMPANFPRETLKDSFEYCRRRYPSPTVRKFLLPFLAMRAVCRWAALRSCKIPAWPVDM